MPSTLRSLRLAAAAVGLTLAATLAHAAGPQQKGQAPGWYRMALGDFEVTALSDGTVVLPWHQIAKAPAAKI